MQHLRYLSSCLSMNYTQKVLNERTKQFTQMFAVYISYDTWFIIILPYFYEMDECFSPLIGITGGSKHEYCHPNISFSELCVMLTVVFLQLLCHGPLAFSVFPSPVSLTKKSWLFLCHSFTSIKLMLEG